MPKVIHHETAILTCYSNDLNFDCVITCPHAPFGDAFFEKFPQIRELVQLSAEDFQRYLSIEYDFGTHELAHAIAEHCWKEHQVSVLIVEPTFPRAVIDAGRLYPNCLRNIIDYSKHPELRQALVDLHQRYVEHLCHIVARAKLQGAICIDLHTMAPHSPKNDKKGLEKYAEAVDETPETLLEYITLFEQSHKEGAKRKTELFTGDYVNGIYANQKLLAELSGQLAQAGAEVDYDQPYILAEHLMGHYLTCELEAVCVDLTKDLLSKYTPQDPEFSLSKLEIDPAKLEKMSFAFAHAIVETLKSGQTISTNHISEKMWGRKAIHLPNTSDIGGADLVSSFVSNYQTRVMCLLAREHKIILPEYNREEVQTLLDYFNHIGMDYLSIDNVIFIDDYPSHYQLSTMALMLSGTIPEFSDRQYQEIVPFTASSCIDLIGMKHNKRHGLPMALSQFLNDKGHLRQMLHNEGILVPSHEIISTYEPGYTDKALACYRALKAQGIHECALIIPRACSGYGIHRFNDEAHLLEIFGLLKHIDSFLIDPWLDNLGSPAFQVYIADREEDDISLGLSDQMLDGHTHLGNKSPSVFSDNQAVKDLCRKVTNILRHKGTRGVVGVDLLIREIDGEIVPYVLEVNARQTGAIYAGFLAYELRGHQCKPWLGHNNIMLPEGTTLWQYYEYLQHQGAAYHIGDQEGVVITCNGNLHNHKIMVLILAETEERIQALLEIAESYQG